LNLVNLNLIGISNLKVTENLKMNIGMGHTMCPFGDFIDENIWIKYKSKIKVDAYLRQFQNRTNWFLGGGFGINDFPIGRKFVTSAHLHFWNQPYNLGFNDTKGRAGRAFEFDGRYFFLSNQRTKLKALSIDMGLTYKTKGFLPEEIFLRRHFGIRLGTSFAIDD